MESTSTGASVPMEVGGPAAEAQPGHAAHLLHIQRGCSLARSGVSQSWLHIRITEGTWKPCWWLSPTLNQRNLHLGGWGWDIVGFFFFLSLWRQLVQITLYHLVVILLRADSLTSEVSFLTDKIESPRESPGGPVVRTWCFHCRGRVWSLVGELRSRKPHSVTKI